VTSEVNRSRSHATTSVSSTHNTNNITQKTTSAVSNTNPTSDHQTHEYSSAVNDMHNTVENRISQTGTDKSSATITVMAGQPAQYQQSDPARHLGQGVSRDRTLPEELASHQYFMSGSRPVPPQAYNPHTMFPASHGQMMYNPHHHPSPWMSNTLQGISGLGRPTTLPYSLSPTPQLASGIAPYSTDITKTSPQ